MKNLKNQSMKNPVLLTMMYQRILLFHVYLIFHLYLMMMMMMMMTTSSRSTQSAQKGELSLLARQRPPGGRFPPRGPRVLPCPRLV